MICNVWCGVLLYINKLYVTNSIEIYINTAIVYVCTYVAHWYLIVCCMHIEHNWNDQCYHYLICIFNYNINFIRYCTIKCIGCTTANHFSLANIFNLIIDTMWCAMSVDCNRIWFILWSHRFLSYGMHLWNCAFSHQIICCWYKYINCVIFIVS